MKWPIKNTKYTYTESKMNDHEPCDCPFCTFVMACPVPIRIMIVLDDEPQKWRVDKNGNYIPVFVD